MGTTYVRIDTEQRDTILAALRTYQEVGYCTPSRRPLHIHDIATDGGTNMGSLDLDGIDELCEHLNTDRCPVERSDECPDCGSLNVEGGSVDIEVDMATQRCHCIDCTASWVLGFGLTSAVLL